MRRSKVSIHLSEVKAGKIEKKYLCGVKMKALRRAYARAVRRDERRAIKARLLDT